MGPAVLRQVNGLQAQYPDAKGLGAQLIRAGLLTPFQVNQLLQGRCTDLVLGPYHIMERLGEGGMGQVFKARHEQLQRIVALKVIRKDRLTSASVLDRFQREARAAAQLTHPNIVTTYDAGQAGETHYLAMEYVEGIDLARLVKEKGPLPVAQACDFVRQAASGLAHAHEKGVVHRDIKPANLLLGKAHGLQSVGVVKILDMGLARLGAQEADPSAASLTQVGTFIGTPDFMAPEQAKNSRNVDARADLYSLGCTLYFLLTGQPPFDGDTAVEKLLHHQLESIPSPRRLRPEVPVPLEAVLNKLMAKRPDDRFQTASAVAEALEPYCSTMPVASRRPAWLGRRRALLVGCLAACLLIGICVFAFSGSGHKAPAADNTGTSDGGNSAASPSTPAHGEPPGEPRTHRKKRDFPKRDPRFPGMNRGNKNDPT